MPSNENKKYRILELAYEKFTSMGILHVTMDEISRGAGIGKGTLYKFFPSKEDLLYATIDFVASQIEKNIDDIMNNEELNPAKKLNLIFKTVGEKLSKINPAVLAYMERSVPLAYGKITEVRQRIIMTNLLKLFEEGKKSGHFDPELDSYLVAHILIGAANHVMDSKVLSTLDYSLENLFKQITETILKGCLTDEGKKQLLP